MPNKNINITALQAASLIQSGMSEDEAIQQATGGAELDNEFIEAVKSQLSQMGSEPEGATNTVDTFDERNQAAISDAGDVEFSEDYTSDASSELTDEVKRGRGRPAKSPSNEENA